MPALDAFHVKQSIWENSIHSSFWHGYTETLIESMDGKYAHLPQGPLGGVGHGFTDGADMDRKVRVTMQTSETFYISPLMNRIVTAAADQWVEDEPITVEDFPTPYGFIYVPGGLSVIDIRGRLQTTEVFTWAVNGDKVRFAYWLHKRHDAPDVRRQSEWQQVPDWLPWHFETVTAGEPVPKMVQFGKVLPPEISEQINWTPGPDGTYMAHFPEGWSAEELTPVAKPDHHLTWIVSALRIMQQPLASVSTQGLPANLRRNLMKRPKRLKNTRVTVIDFRRRVGDYEHHGDREYTHRFLRRGHWRRQPYKREDGTWDRRRIWIHPTVVGDPSLPLMFRDHVNALTR